VAAIRDEIQASAGGRITFARFMERALTEPDLGYYATSELRPTRTGDFLTAPELHPLFGRCIGRLVGAAQTASGRSSYRVLEYGAGRGTLRDSASTGLGSGLRWARADLPSRSDEPPGPVDLVIANEYVDALPVHRLVRCGELCEAYVTWVRGWFAEVVAEPSTPALAGHLEAGGIELREGQRADVCLAAPRWMGQTALRLDTGGVLLVIDYGHDAAELYGPRRMAGSLLTYREHRLGHDPFTAVGHTDITSHVDISSLERAATEAGLALIGATTQGPFLARLGLGQMLAELGRNPDADAVAYLEARSAVARLLDPRHLGAFKVMAWGRPDAAGTVVSLPGFADTP
jgi:SAM-dependent MidA family methyltransferase